MLITLKYLILTNRYNLILYMFPGLEILNEYGIVFFFICLNLMHTLFKSRLNETDSTIQHLCDVKI